MPYKDKKKQKEVHKRLQAQRAERNRALILAAKSSGCVVCGEKDPIVLDFHHLDPTTKRFNIAIGLSRSEKSLFAEIAKCVVLCANDHRRIEAGMVQLNMPLSPSG